MLTVDLHAGQIQGFFDIPTDNLFGAPTMVRDIEAHHNGSKNVMVVSPDVGGVVRARALAKRLDAPLAIVDKRRDRAGESEVMNIIGDVDGRNCVLLDDIVDSGGTLCNAADALLEKGAASVSAYITHGVLSGGAVARVAASQAQRTRAHRHDRADRGGPGRAQHPRDLDCAPDRRGDRAHRQGGKRLLAVQLTGRSREARVRSARGSYFPVSTCRRHALAHSLNSAVGKRPNMRAASIDRTEVFGTSAQMLDTLGAGWTYADQLVSFVEFIGRAPHFGSRLNREELKCSFALTVS